MFVPWLFFFNCSAENCIFIEVDSEGASWIILFKIKEKVTWLLYNLNHEWIPLGIDGERVKAAYFIHKFCGCCNQDTTQIKLSNKIFMCSNKIR